MTDKTASREEPPEAAPAAGRPGRWGSWLLRWGLELIVVFVGVYAAFALSQHQRERELDDYRDQIEAALAREIEAITANARRAAEQFPEIAAHYDSLISLGARPALNPMIEPIRVRNHMWEATIASGGLDVLDVATLYRISEFYNALNAGFEQLSQLRELCESLLIPNLDRGPDEFYEPETGELRPKYQWYLDGLHRVGRLAEEVTRLGDDVVADLREGNPMPDR